MIVQPASLGPRSRSRRLARSGALALPVVAFVAIVAAGLAGPARDPVPSAPVPAEATAPAVIGDGVTPTAGAAIVATRPVFPGRVDGLQVHGVRWTLDARSRGLARGRIAIAGYLGEEVAGPGCRFDQPAFPRTACVRVAVLAADPWDGRSVSERELPPYHLHAQVLAGVDVRVGEPATDRPNDPRSLAVIVVAHFDDPRAEPCVPEGRHCGQELVIESVAWRDDIGFGAPSTSPAPSITSPRG